MRTWPYQRYRTVVAVYDTMPLHALLLLFSASAAVALNITDSCWCCRHLHACFVSHTCALYHMHHHHVSHCRCCFCYCLYSSLCCSGTAQSALCSFISHHCTIYVVNTAAVSHCVVHCYYQSVVSPAAVAVAVLVIIVTAVLLYSINHIMRVPLAVIGGLELVCGDVNVPPSIIFRSDIICSNNINSGIAVVAIVVMVSIHKTQSGSTASSWHNIVAIFSYARYKSAISVEQYFERQQKTAYVYSIISARDCATAFHSTHLAYHAPQYYSQLYTVMYV
jgi:hypothetical protein